MTDNKLFEATTHLLKIRSLSIDLENYTRSESFKLWLRFNYCKDENDHASKATTLFEKLGTSCHLVSSLFSIAEEDEDDDLDRISLQHHDSLERAGILNVVSAKSWDQNALNLTLDPTDDSFRRLQIANGFSARKYEIRSNSFLQICKSLFWLTLFGHFAFGHFFLYFPDEHCAVYFHADSGVGLFSDSCLETTDEKIESLTDTTIFR